MKKVFILLVVAVFISFFFTSCTENIVTDDEQLIFQTQAIDKEDSTTPNSNGGTTVDPDED